jgi:photosystem II stability/assembly factor-like uncharacterized protein
VADEMGARPIPAARHDAEPTINEGGEQGFAVDGTDSFTVPGPADGLPAELVDEEAAARAAAMRRLLVTLGVAIAVLAVVIVVGRSGGSGGERVAGDSSASEFTLPSLFGDVGAARDRSRQDASDDDDTTSSTYDFDDSSSSRATFPDDSDPYGSEFDDDSLTSYPETSDPFDDEFSDDDFDVPYYTPSRTTPRTFPRYTPPAPRPRAPASATTTSEPDDTEPEPDPTTTSTSTTTTTSSTTTTTSTTTPAPTSPTTPQQPASAWKAPTTPLGVVCGQDQVRLWAGHQSVLAGIGAARVWHSTDGGATWAAIALGAAPTAFADDPADPATAWVATSTGVFKVAAGVPTKIGDLANVTSLSAAGTGASSTLVAVSNGQVQRWVDAAPGWTPTAALPVGAVPGEVLALDGDSFVVGTDDGIFRSDGGGPWLVPSAASAGVVGAPARSGGTISWLLADRSGLLRSTDNGVTWKSVPASGIAADATALASVPSLGLVTSGASVPLVSSIDGVAWAPLTDQPPYRPDGVVRAGLVAGTTVWTSKCGQTGQPTAADAVLRLADSP